MRTFGIAVAVVLGLVVMTLAGWAIRVALLPARVIDKSITTTEGIIDKTLTADNAIYNYEWFKQQYEDIQATQNKIDNARSNYAAFKADLSEERSQWTFEDKTEASRLNSVVLGLENYREQQVADYNARANMANRNIFEDGTIPSILEIGSGFLK